MDFISRNAAADTPFFLYASFTHVSSAAGCASRFRGKFRIELG